MGVSEYTPAQLRGVTDTSDAGEPEIVEEPGAWEQPTIEDASVRGAYGEIEALIPGMGEAAEDCGDWVPQSFCDGEDAHVHMGKHLCGRRECPRCWSGQWAGPRTTNVVQKLAAGRHAESEGIDRRLVHGFVSPEDGSVESVEQLFGARTKALEIAKEHGIRGGVCVVHGYRPTAETKRRFKEAKESGFEGGIWRFIRENDQHWYGQVYWSPHFHIIGLCRDFEEAGEREDGWVVQNLSTGYGSEPNPNVDRRFSPFENLHDAEPYEDMISAVRYLLSHATFVEGRQAVSWFGSLSGRNFDPEEDISSGSWKTIQRRVEELVGVEDDRSEEGAEEDEKCPVEGCEGYVHHITDVPQYLDQRGDDLAIEAVTRLRAAFDWFIGAEDELPEPPPSCSTEAEAEEYLSQIC